jgi:hypothetical protein
VGREGRAKSSRAETDCKARVDEPAEDNGRLTDEGLVDIRESRSEGRAGNPDMERMIESPSVDFDHTLD